MLGRGAVKNGIIGSVMLAALGAMDRSLLGAEAGSPRIPAAPTADETPQPRLPKSYTIPIIDLSKETARRVIVAQGTKDKGNNIEE